MSCEGRVSRKKKVKKPSFFFAGNGKSDKFYPTTVG